MIPNCQWHDYDQVVNEEVTPPANKYNVRPPKDLRSKYELKMEERRMKQLTDEEAELRKAEAERLRVRPCWDALYSLLFLPVFV